MRSSIVIGLIIGSAALASGCGGSGQAAATNDAQKPERVSIPVQVEVPLRSNISAYFETTARVQAENRVDVVSKGMGLCLAVNAEEGDLVKAGEVLAELDKEELETQIRQTRVNVEKSKTALEIAEKSLQEGIGSKVERDNARFAYDAALATLQAQDVQLKNQTIVAPINGVVTRRNIQKGMLVSTGMPAFSVVDPASYFLPINPPEKELTRLSVGQQAKVTIDSCQSQEFVATVRRINPSVDPLSGTVKVTLDFDDSARPCLREAAFARVRLVMETHEGALLVPKDSVLEENARKYLMVVRDAKEAPPADPSAESPADGKPADEKPADDKAADDKAADDKVVEEKAADTSDKQAKLVAERVEVTVGLEDSNNIEIVSGIDDTSRVVTLGQHTLKPGAEVVVTNVKDAILSGSEANKEKAEQNVSAS